MSFSPEYRAQLEDTYPKEIVAQIADPNKWHNVSLAPHQPGQTLPYVDVRGPETPDDARPLVLVPGFGAGIVNRASFAAELAVQGQRVILTGQNRRGILRNPDTGKRDATYTQAQNYVAVVDAVSGPNAAPHHPTVEVDVIANSYGVLVFDEMVRQQPDRFTDSNAVLLAPAGTIRGQTLLNMGRQWLAMAKSEAPNGGQPFEFPDLKGITGKASAGVLLQNIPRTMCELRDLLGRTVDYKRLARLVGSVSVLTYAEDAMFSPDKLEPMLREATEHGIRWSSPTAIDRVLSGELTYGGQSSVHDGEQFHPGLMAAAVLATLAPTKPGHGPNLVDLGRFSDHFPDGRVPMFSQPPVPPFPAPEVDRS